MKLEFPYKPGDIITIYADWEKEESPIGTARLVSLHKQGRTFILEDTYPEESQVVYNYQEWKISDIIPLGKTVPAALAESYFYNTYKVRYVDTIGIANSADDEESETEQKNLPIDSFIEIFGIQIY